MPTILQISIEVNSGSVGRIAEQIGEKIIDKGWESYITFARNNLPSKSKTIRIGKKIDILWHGLMTRIFDNHCLESKSATNKLIQQIKEIDPDVIHLHHIHGYFINMKILFNYLSQANKPIVWTFHDCWSFTGHCAYFDYVDCHKWKTHCGNCPQKKEYPKSLFLDRSHTNFSQKRALFNSVSNMTIVPVSYWLGNMVQQSFLNQHALQVIQNGIDLQVFKPQVDLEEIKMKYNISNKFVVLGVASIWDRRKGLDYFIQLSEKINPEFQIILVGLNRKQIKALPQNVIGIERTENVNELAKLYSVADVFVNPTLEDTFPTTNLESLACGTPVVTFRTGGSVESVTEETGFVVEKGDLNGLVVAIDEVWKKEKKYYFEFCRKRAESLYNKNDNFQNYINLYEEILKINH